jgi:hypothetical protein
MILNILNAMTIMKIRGALVDMFCDIDSELYSPYVVPEMEKSIICRSINGIIRYVRSIVISLQEDPFKD